MAKKLGFVVWLAALWLLPGVAAAADNATISGVVRNAAGKPQMGAVIEVISSATSIPARAYTDEKGRYTVAGLLPGTYYVKATADSFLPSLREGVAVASGAHVLVNLTLNTLFEALQFMPVENRAPREEDDWRWTLRSAANRPILRVLEHNGPLVVVSRSNDGSDHVLKARVAFIAGSDGDGFSTGDMKTAFNVEQSLFASGTMGVRGNISYGEGQANGMVRLSYRHEMSNGSHPEIAITARRFATDETAVQHAAVSALALSMSDGFTLADFMELNYGGELQSIEFRGRANAFRPFARAAAHLSPDTILEYRYATSLPTTRDAKGFDTSPADLTETNPRLSLRASMPLIESAHHHEVAVSHRAGKNRFQVAAYSDSTRNTALDGVGDVDVDSGAFLPDIYSSTFTYSGPDLRTNGVRLVAERRFNDALTATLDYAFGGALVVDPSLPNEAGPQIEAASRHAVAGKFSGNIARSKTRWIASYRWTSGHGAITPVDAFNISPGQADPYLSFFIRQQLPCVSFLPGKVEALVDVRNLLAQGYVPMLGSDGRTLYLVQAARSIRGGVAFNF